MEIIGILGHQGVGKNYLAENILLKFLENKPTIIIAFADHLKIDIICKHDIEYDRLFIKKDFEARKKLQIEGTEEGRNKYGEDIWIKAIYSWMKVFYSRGIKRFIIPDVRFQNEVNWIKSLNGLVIKLEAPKRYMNKVVQETGKDIDRIKEIILHKSEQEIDKIKNYDISLKNDEDDDLSIEVGKLFKYLNNMNFN